MCKNCQIVCKIVITYLTRSSTACIGLSKMDKEVKEYNIDCPIVDFNYFDISFNNSLVVPLKLFI